MREKPLRAKGLMDPRELIDIAGIPRKEVWRKISKAHGFVFDESILGNLAYYCGLDVPDSPEDFRRRKAFDADANEAAKIALITTMLDRARPLRTPLRKAARKIGVAARKLQDELIGNRWEILVGEIVPDDRRGAFFNFEKNLNALIRDAEDADRKFQRGAKLKKLATAPSRAFAVVFNRHVWAPPEKCSPRCTEAAVIENVRAARRLFVKRALFELGVEFPRPAQDFLRKIPIPDEALQKILQETI